MQAIRGGLRLRAEQKIHSLVAMQVMHDCVQRCTDKAAVLARYPAEAGLQRRVPGRQEVFRLVTTRRATTGAWRRECPADVLPRFMVDPDLFSQDPPGHRLRPGLSARSNSPTPMAAWSSRVPLPVLQFISVLYRDMGELIEACGARAFADGDASTPTRTAPAATATAASGTLSPEDVEQPRSSWWTAPLPGQARPRRAPGRHGREAPSPGPP